VYGGFYATLAQVLPLLLLALIWDSGFLKRLRQQRRVLRRRASKKDDPDGVRFWVKPRVRWYMLLVAVVVMASTAVPIMVLAGQIPDSHALRVVLSGGLVLVLLTLFTRITVDVLWATTDDPAKPDAQPPGTPAVPPAAAPAAQPGVGTAEPGQSLPPPPAHGG
jgi:hypothetical protein